MPFGEPNVFRDDPEKYAIKTEALKTARPFEILTNQVPESIVLKDLQDQKLKAYLLAYDWPVEEAACERIAEKLGLSAERVAAVSKYHRAIEAEVGMEKAA